LLRFERTFEVCSQQRAPERIDDLELPRKLDQEAIITFFMEAVQAHLDPARRRVEIVLGIAALLNLGFKREIRRDGFLPYSHPYDLRSIHLPDPL